MNLDNQRLQSIQRMKHIIKKKIETCDDFEEKELLWDRYFRYNGEEQRILKDFGVK